MAEIMLTDNTNVSNVATQLTLNGTVPFTNAEPVIRLPLDTHQRHAEDVRMMMGFEAITTLKGNTKEILPENANLHSLFVLIYISIVQKVERLLYSSSFIPFSLNKPFTMFLPPNSCFNPTIYPSSDKPYPPAILVKHSMWFLKDANLFICHGHFLYGLHLSLFNQSPLFWEIILYGESNEISINPYHPIPFDTLMEKVFDNFLYLLYFGTEHMEYLSPNEWLNIKRLSTDWHFPRLTATIIR
jgi:hypothetical protein